MAGLAHILGEAEKRNLRPDDLKLEIRGDSALVIEQLSGNWKIKSLTLQALHDQAVEQLAHFGSYELNRQPRKEIQRMLGH